ncbi:MAG: nucleotide exchange factor GrpE [Ruminococcaceae bacterium]|nr:nucleotide exchange factor GrpE [Oscillospiraceae bacterium]
MILNQGDNVILYGSNRNISQALGEKLLDTLNVISVCSENILDEDELPEWIDCVDLKDLPRYENTIVLVVNKSFSKKAEAYFCDNNIQYCMFDEVQIAEPVAEEEPLPESEGAEEVAEQVPEEECKVTSLLSQEQWEELSAKVVSCENDFLRALRNLKEKDDAIYNINKELQKYKDDYYNKLTMPLLGDLISLREDCKTSLENLDKYQLPAEKQKQYVAYSVEQVENILQTYDVEIEDGKYFYNGQVIFPKEDFDREPGCNKIKEVAIDPMPEIIPISPVSSLETLYEAFQTIQKNIETVVLQGSNMLAQAIRLQNDDLKKQQKITDGLLSIPLFVKVIRLKQYFEKQSQEMVTALTDEEVENLYRQTYQFATESLEQLLLSYEIRIRSNIDDLYDPRYHKIIKMVKVDSEEAEKDKKIAQFCSDCYVKGERVIQPAKVVVYRI